MNIIWKIVDKIAPYKEVFYKDAEDSKLWILTKGSSSKYGLGYVYATEKIKKIKLYFPLEITHKNLRDHSFYGQQFIGLFKKEIADVTELIAASTEFTKLAISPICLASNKLEKYLWKLYLKLMDYRIGRTKHKEFSISVPLIKKAIQRLSSLRKA